MSKQEQCSDAPIMELPLTEWTPSESATPNIAEALERGEVLHLPHLHFPLTEEEQKLLDPRLVSPKRKNISYRPEENRFRGVSDEATEAESAALKALLERYHRATVSLITHLVPHYKGKLKGAMNTLRLNAIDEWSESHSFRKDDRRLHLDAFPSRPLHGERIIRIFNNINPHGVPRSWRVGEPFPQLVKRLLPRVKPYSALGSHLLNLLQITKSRRTHYDHLMLQFHDLMKEDQHYQDHGEQWPIDFAPGATWICFSDQTPHAAMSGQFMLEQTFQLSVDDMVNPEQSPLHILEEMVGHPLI